MAASLPASSAPPPSVRGMGRNWLVYGVSSVASRLVGFLLLPVYTRILSPEDYGIRAMVALSVDLVALLFSFGIGTAMTRYYAGEGDRRHPEAISTGLLVKAGTFGIGVMLGLACSAWLTHLILGDPVYAPYLRLGLVSLFFISFVDSGMTYLRARQRAGTVAILSLASLLAAVALNVLFVVVWRWGVAGIFYAEILVHGVLAVGLTVATLRAVGTRFVPALAGRMLRYGAPLTLMPLTWLLVNRVDGLFLTHYGSLAQVGVYALAVQCAQVLLVAVIYPFRDVWDPGQFEVARNQDGGRLYARMFQLFTVTIVVAAFAFAVAAEEVIEVMTGPAFHGAAAVVPILLASHVVMGACLLFNSGLLVRNRTSLLGAIAVVTAVVNVSANAVLVPRYLAMGAGLSRLIALLVMASLTYALAQRVWPQRVPFASLAKAVAGALALFAIGLLLPDSSRVVALALKAVLAAALIVFAVASGAVARDDVARVTRRLGRLAGRGRRAQPADAG